MVMVMVIILMITMNSFFLWDDNASCCVKLLDIYLSTLCALYPSTLCAKKGNTAFDLAVMASALILHYSFVCIFYFFHSLFCFILYSVCIYLVFYHVS